MLHTPPENRVRSIPSHPTQPQPLFFINAQSSTVSSSPPPSSSNPGIFAFRPPASVPERSSLRETHLRLCLRTVISARPLDKRTTASHGASCLDFVPHLTSRYAALVCLLGISRILKPSLPTDILHSRYIITAKTRVSTLFRPLPRRQRIERTGLPSVRLADLIRAPATKRAVCLPQFSPLTPRRDPPSARARKTWDHLAPPSSSLDTSYLHLYPPSPPPSPALPILPARGSTTSTTRIR